MPSPAKRELNNIEIAVLALAQLGGATRKVRHEQVAAKAFELAPDRFGWILPEYRAKGWPDKESVRSALEDAKKIKHGRLVQGGYNKEQAKDGWRLTSAGAQWIMTEQQRILDGLDGGHAKIPKKEAQRFCARIKREHLFRQFTEAGNLNAATKYEFTDMLECSPDAPTEVVRAKFDHLGATARLVEDAEVVRFLNACTTRFSSLLSTNGEAR